MLLQLLHDIIGHSVTFFFRQFRTKSAHKLARASQRELAKLSRVATGSHEGMRTKEEHIRQCQASGLSAISACGLIVNKELLLKL